MAGVVLRYALLGLLAQQPSSGHDLARLFAGTVAVVWPASHRQIFPELGRLAGAGLVRRSGIGRRHHVYEVTDAGRAALAGWLTATEPDRAVRSESALRAFFLWTLPPDEQRAVLADEEAAHRHALEGYEALAAGLDGDDDAARAWRIAVERGIRHERAMLDWAAWAVDQLGAPGGGTEGS